ncbi:MAG: SulP family sulfate permease [Granulosicoccus sp.]|jgi:SulP family sulfate permease
MKRFIDFSHFRFDLLGGITAGIVALPLALAFGEQSGLGAAAGLYGAAFIAFFASLFGGTPTQISGPTAPMTALSMVVAAGIIQANEGHVEQALPAILLVFMLAGIIQIVLGLLKLGTFIEYIPYTVVSGFMSGIGVIILITQMLPLMGYNAANDQQVVDGFLPHAEELILDRILMEEAETGILVLEDFKETIDRAHEITPEDIRLEAVTLAANDARGVMGSLKYLPRALGSINWMEFLLALLTIAIIYGFKRITTVVPSTLVALLVVSLGAYFGGVEYLKIREIPSGLPEFHLDIFTGFDLAGTAPYLLSALMLALLGAIDSLLTSVVADNLTKTQHDPNQELVGQGIGNSVAALFGGLPGAGATIRTVVNIQAGGKTKLSGMVAGLLLFVILVSLGPLASTIPAAVLAGILITVGIGVMDYKGLKALPKMETSEKAVLILVLVLTVFWQLVYAVAIGLVLASVVFLKRMSDISSDTMSLSNLDEAHEAEALWDDEIEMDPAVREKVIFKHMNGPLFFGMTTHFRRAVSELPEVRLLVIRMERVPFIDQSGVYALEASLEELKQQRVVVAISGADEKAVKLMKDMHLIPKYVPEQLVFDDFQDCRKWLRGVIKNSNGFESKQDLIDKA